VHPSSCRVSRFIELFAKVLAINISMQDFIGQPFYIGNNPGNTDLEGVGNNFPQNIGNYLLVTQCRPRRLEPATS
jgi:hypothetical protein